MNVAIILHSGSDHRTARRLQKALLEQGLIAELSSSASAQVRTSARAVLILWSAASVADDGIVREALKARRKGRLVQIKIADCDVPSAFGEVDGVLLQGWQGERADPRFQYIARAATELMAQTGLLQQPPRPRGVAHRRTLLRTLFASAIAGVLLLASYIGAAQNLDAGRRAVCGLPGVSNVCVALGIAEPRQTFVSRVTGAWSQQGAHDCFEISTRQSPDGVQVMTAWPSGYRGLSRIVETYSSSKAELVTLQPCRGYREMWTLADGELLIRLDTPDPLSNCPARRLQTTYHRCGDIK